MSAQPYHKRYHSDALAGFMSLSLEERGAYQTLLDMIYDRGGPLPDNPRLIAGYMGCSLRKWASIRDALLAKGKIHLLEDGSISNARAEKEIENYAKTSRKLAENGAKGGRKKAENQEKSNENSKGEKQGLEPGFSLPEARSQKSSDTNVSGVPPPDPVKALFDLGVDLFMADGKTRGESRALVAKFRKDFSDERLASLLITARSKTDPVSWLQGCKRSDGDDRRALYDSINRKYAA